MGLPAASSLLLALAGGEAGAALALRGAYAVDGALHVNVFGRPEGKPVTSGHRDMKPSWSRTGDMIVFFRVTKFAPHVGRWKTAICKVNADGTGFHRLTAGDRTDYNPTWTRDGANTVVFSRYDADENRCVIYRTTAGSDPGEEEVVSDPRHSEYVFSALEDGRLFISSGRRPGRLPYYLFTPGRGGEDAYEPVNFTFPVEGNLARLTVAPSETRVAYEYKKGWKGFDYAQRVVYVADFDVKTRTVSNPVAVTETDPPPGRITLYPRWTTDESAVVYHSNRGGGKNQLYLYRLADRTTVRVSADENADYLQPCGEGAPK